MNESSLNDKYPRKRNLGTLPNSMNKDSDFSENFTNKNYEEDQRRVAEAETVGNKLIDKVLHHIQQSNGASDIKNKSNNS